MSSFWNGRRVVVTGGAGFLGSFVVEPLARGRRVGVRAPRRRDYDLVDRAAARRLLADARPDLVIHLAAQVGGIGANRDNPGRFLFENAMMGLQLFEECRLAGVAKLVAPAPSAPTRSSRRCRSSEDDLWNGYPEETNAPYGVAKKMMLVQSQAYRAAVRHEQRRALPGQPLRPARQLRSRDLARHPGDDPQVRRRARRAASRRSRCGATARRRASSSTSRTPPRGSCWRPSATTRAIR